MARNNARRPGLYRARSLLAVSQRAPPRRPGTWLRAKPSAASCWRPAPAARFGGRKLLHPLPDGTPIGVAALRNLHDALPRVPRGGARGGRGARGTLRREGARVLECAEAVPGHGSQPGCGSARRARRAWLDRRAGRHAAGAAGEHRALAERLARGRAHRGADVERRARPSGRLRGVVAARSCWRCAATRCAQRAAASRRARWSGCEVDDPGIVQDVDTVRGCAAPDDARDAMIGFAIIISEPTQPTPSHASRPLRLRPQHHALQLPRDAEVAVSRSRWNAARRRRGRSRPRSAPRRSCPVAVSSPACSRTLLY